MGARPGQLAKYSAKTSVPKPAPPTPQPTPYGPLNPGEPARGLSSEGLTPPPTRPYGPLNPGEPARGLSSEGLKPPSRMAAAPSQNTAVDRYQATQKARQDQLNLRRQVLGLGSIALPTPTGLQAPTPASGYAPGGAQTPVGQFITYLPSTPTPSQKA